MATQSKMIFDMVSAILSQALFGSKRKKIMSFSIVVIIGFLIHMRNQRSNYENLKFSKLSIKDKDKGKGNVDSLFFERIKKLLKIVVPRWNCV